jgi:hypothetical protein
MDARPCRPADCASQWIAIAHARTASSQSRSATLCTDNWSNESGAEATVDRSVSKLSWNSSFDPITVELDIEALVLLGRYTYFFSDNDGRPIAAQNHPIVDVHRRHAYGFDGVKDEKRMSTTDKVVTVPLSLLVKLHAINQRSFNDLDCSFELYDVNEGQFFT